MPWQKSRYPANWQEIATAVKTRAGWRCERCGLPNHCVGYRDEDGDFMPLRGNGPCDAAGRGRSWPDTQNPLTFREAKAFVDQYNDHCGTGRSGRGTGKRKTDADGNRWVVIVLTTAHVGENKHDKSDCSSLLALCQSCHLREDIEEHKARAARTRQAKKDRTAVAAPLFSMEEAR